MNTPVYPWILATTYIYSVQGDPFVTRPGTPLPQLVGTLPSAATTYIVGVLVPAAEVCDAKNISGH